jgi:hypothetical protein
MWPLWLFSAAAASETRGTTPTSDRSRHDPAHSREFFFLAGRGQHDPPRDPNEDDDDNEDEGDDKSEDEEPAVIREPDE